MSEIENEKGKKTSIVLHSISIALCGIGDYYFFRCIYKMITDSAFMEAGWVLVLVLFPVIFILICGCIATFVIALVLGWRVKDKVKKILLIINIVLVSIPALLISCLLFL